MEHPHQPNFLVVVPDQFRRDFVGSYNRMPVRTPHIDGLAQDGVSFMAATTPSPVCAPARACLATGSCYDECGVANNLVDFDTGRETFYSMLRDDRYEVATCGKVDLHKGTKYWGRNGDHFLSEMGFTRGIDTEGKLDAVKAYGENGFSAQGPYMAFLERHGLAETHYNDFTTRDQWLDTHPTPLPDFAYFDNWVADHACRLLSEFDVGKPWFLAVNFPGPHNPQDITESMEQRWRGQKFPPAIGNSNLPAEQLNAIRQNYAAMVENIDRHVGRMLEIIKARGEAENTVIVFTSDHGEMLGDHDRWGKSVWYQQSCGIPFIVKAPDAAHGLTSDALVQFQDIAPTVLDYAGLPHAAFPAGRSVRSLLNSGSSDFRPVAHSGFENWRMAFDGRYKLVANSSDEHVLYDLQLDPHETQDAMSSAADEARRLSESFPSAFQIKS